MGNFPWQGKLLPAEKCLPSARAPADRAGRKETQQAIQPINKEGPRAGLQDTQLMVLWDLGARSTSELLPYVPPTSPTWALVAFLPRMPADPAEGVWGLSASELSPRLSRDLRT